MQRSPRSSHGFTLVEVTMAIGIFAFALVSIFGLLGAATQSDLASDRDTILVRMANQVLNDLRPVPFDCLWKADPHSDIERYFADLPNPPRPKQSDIPEPSEYFFTADGLMITPKPDKGDPRIIYYCEVVKSPDKASNVDSTRSYGADGRANRLTLEMKFEWPFSAPEANRRGRVLYESLARYY